MKRQLRRRQVLLPFFLAFLFVVQPYATLYAAMTEAPATGFGKVVDARKTELAPGAVYTWYNMEIERGLEKMHFVEFDPKNPNLELRAGTKSGKVYGMQGVTQMAAYADAPGNRVIAGINGDFYDLTGYATGVPDGLFMDEGRILNSNSSSFAFGLKSDGTSIYGTPKLTMTVTIGGETTNLTSINRYRDTNHLVLYTPDYSTSTKTTALGTEAVLKVLEGEVKSGHTMRLQVTEIRANQGDAPLAEGTVVLSASGTKTALLSGLKVGDEITASFALSGEWHDVKVAIGGKGPLIKDGVVQTNVGPEGVHPRTAIGTKADGSIVLFEIDGRAPGFSEGVTTEELARILKDIGVVNAMNLDGGGSSTFVARMPGTAGVKMLNQGSDGGERSTGNALLLVNTAPEQAASRLVVTPNEERILAGSSFKFEAAAVDAAGHPAAWSGQPVWSVEPELGTIDADGVFTAGQAAASGQVAAVSEALRGTAEIEVVDRLTGLQFPDAIKTFHSGASAVLSVTALRDGQVIQASNDAFEWRVEGDIGTIDGNGVFTATTESGKSGKIHVRYKDVETSMDVNVGLPPVVLEDFENGIDRYTASGAAYNSAAIALETDPDFVRSGNASIKLTYDFVGKTGTSGAYIATKSADVRIQVPGYPEKIGMWVYGDGKKHWLRAQMRDGGGSAFPVDFTDQTTGVDWTGWKYVEAAVPKGKAAPLTIDLPVRYMETNNANKTSGTIYVDQIRAIYGPLEEDRTPPIIKDVHPADNETVKTGNPDIYAYAEDDGYDPVSHPGTTLIDPHTIRLYIDGVLVSHSLYPPEGRVTYKPAVPLEDGYHRAKLAVRDLSGNQTIKEWNFSVDTGMAKLKYDTPKEVYAGHLYTVDITADKASTLSGGHLELQFDPSVVSELSVIKGDKLADGQMEPSVDPATGVVRVAFNGLESSALADSDVLARIAYRVNGTASGTHTIGFVSSSLLLAGADEPKPYLGAPLQSAILHELKLSWDEKIGQGFTTTFTVTDAEGRPVEGAMLVADGVQVGDGTLVTDANGILRTDALTAAVKTYKLQAVKGEKHSEIVSFTTLKLAGSETPSNISVTMGQDPATSRGFTWHTHPNTEPSVVELAKASEFAGFESSNVLRVTGNSYLFNTLDLGTIRVHKAAVENLEPGTAYVYRVGDGEGHYSAQGVFETAPLTGESTKFLVFGDSQAADLPGFTIWGNTLKKAMDENPDAEFVVHLGDMVDNGFKEQEWNWWFSQAQEQLMRTTVVTVVGNHEVTGTKGNGDFLAHFNHPQNGTDRQKGTNYSFDYKDIHFAVLNSEYDYAEQKEWLRSDLAGTDKKWKIVFFHRGPYGSIYDTEVVRNEWTPVFDEFGVDLVMNGHDHIYLRTYPMKGNAPAADGDGTTYIIPGATGPKFYDLTPRPWQYIYNDEDVQMFSSVVVSGSKLTVETKTIDGRVVDTFELEKPAITVDPAEAELRMGERLQLNALVTPPGEVVWSVASESAPGVVSVSEDGTVVALRPGDAVVRASSAQSARYYGESVIHVPDELASLELSGKPELAPGESDRSVLVAVYASGLRETVTEGAVYYSSRPEVATVDASGRVEALAEGTTEISVTYQGLTAAYLLRVAPESPGAGESRLRLTGPESLRVGETAPTVAELVYGDGRRFTLTEGVVYDSSEPSVAAIDGSGILRALNAGTSVISAVYEGKTATANIRVIADPIAVPPPAGASDDGGKQSPGRLTVTKEQLDGLRTSDEIRLTLPEALTELVLPGSAGQLPAGKSLVIQAKNMTVVLPSEALAPLAGKLTDEELADSVIRFKANAVTEERLQQLLNRAETLSGAELRPAGEAFEFSLTLTDKRGNVVEADAFERPVVISLPVPEGADLHLVGIYYLDGSNAEYVGGTVKDGTITARLNHFSVYAALEYDKTFSDLKDGHWAAQAVKRLAAKHAVKGEADGRFAPERPVTRAEFAAMLARTLGLTGEAGASFKDVAPDQWFAGEVARLAQAGIVQGGPDGTFEPAKRITRQEMAVMIVRAYEYATGQQAASGGEAKAFRDIASVPEWSREAVLSAGRLGLVNGNAGGEFRPMGEGSRAESAQMIYNLMQLMESNRD